MAIQDSINSMIGSVTRVAGAKFLKEKAVTATKTMQEEVTQMKFQREEFKNRLDKILAEGKLDNVTQDFGGQATVHPALGQPYGGKKINLNEKDVLENKSVQTALKLHGVKKMKGGLD